MRLNVQRKKEFVYENVENDENETIETRYFVERDRNRRKNDKNKTSINKHIVEEKREMISRREKHGRDTQKEK